ncbi:hypothetical protein BpHYR1_009862 [Brachionus plicatilis]|uniref:Uncharacterized protein n=1 Tax=Brachionus plicatilis TaxID=10195 RepID=A0A3M7SEU7_BRAPC|nr:hypothetical protein BpHYR1_009862 [Brachionus plicatilis]
MTGSWVSEPFKNLCLSASIGHFWLYFPKSWTKWSEFWLAMMHILMRMNFLTKPFISSSSLIVATLPPLLLHAPPLSLVGCDRFLF